MHRTDELSVIGKAKDLSLYIMTVTEKSPKRFRFTITSRLQNYSLDVIEHLYRANAVFVTGNSKAKMISRLDFQYKAMTELRLLGFMAEVALRQQCILQKQYEQISRMIYDCRNMLSAWITSDRKRFAKTLAEN